MIRWLVIAVISIVLLGGAVMYLTMGAGGFKRAITSTGIYAVCKPEGYPTVCFLDADSHEGGLSCIPFSGECKK